MDKQNMRGKVILLAILSVVLIILIIIAMNLQKPNPNSKNSLYSDKIVSKQIREIEANYLDENGVVSLEEVTALIDDVYDGIKDSDYVEYIEKHDASVYYILDNNLGCHYIAPIPGLASSGNDLAIYSYQPWYTDFDRQNTDFLEGMLDIIYNDGVEYPNQAINILEKADLTENSAHYLYDEDVTIETLKNLRGNSVILWVGHGGYSSEFHSTLALTTKFTEVFYEDHRYEFENHLLEKYDDEYVAVTSLFFDKYLADGCLENSIIYLAACHSAEDDVLATALLNKGAAVVYGNSDLVWQSYNNRMCKTVLKNLCDGNTSGEALQRAQKEHGEVETQLWFWTRSAYVRCCGESNLTLSTLCARIKNNSQQGQSSNIDTTPTQQELFGGKCWRTTTGNVDAVHHAVTKFFGDGTYIGYSLITGTKFSGTYTYENGVLVYNDQIWDLEDTRNFKSRTLHSISLSGSEIYQEIFAGGEDDWNYYADKEQPDNSRKDWFVGTWKCRIQSDGETFVNEIGFAENGEVYIYDSIENGETFATVYGEWELIEQEGDLYYIELTLPGTDEDGTAIQFRTRITIEKQGQQAYIRHLSGQQTDIYYDCLFVRE